MNRQCFAYSPLHGRCGLEASHEGEHSVTHEWGDDECVNPADLMLTATGGRDVPIVKVTSDPVHLVTTGRCFACGCDMGAHHTPEGMCAKHQCRQFVA